MSVTVTDLRVLKYSSGIQNCDGTQDNPAPWHDSIKFEISYACYTSLKHDLEWRVTYVGSAEDESFDQELDTVCVGPIHPGQYKFVFQVDPPDVNRIPRMDVLGVTVILLTCSYNGKEFIRVGYYVNNEYSDEELRQHPPETPRLDKVTRNILADKPRVTRFEHDFDNEQAAAANNIPELGAATAAADQDMEKAATAGHTLPPETPTDAMMVDTRS